MQKVRDVENITHFINGCILGLSKLSQEGIAHLIDCNCRASRLVTSYSQCWKSSVFSSKYRMNYDELFGNVWEMEDSEGKCFQWMALISFYIDRTFCVFGIIFIRTPCNSCLFFSPSMSKSQHANCQVSADPRLKSPQCSDGITKNKDI